MNKPMIVAREVKKRAAKTSSVSARRAEDLVDLVRRRLAHIAEDFYDMGLKRSREGTWLCSPKGTHLGSRLAPLPERGGVTAGAGAASSPG